MKSAILYAPLFGLAIAAATPALGQSQQFPTYTVGPQANGTYVMSTTQIISPAGTLAILGSPIRAKAVALNPVNPATAAVLNMGAYQAVQIVSATTGAVLQNYSPFGDSEGSFTGITYTPDGTKLLFSQDDSYVAVANVDPNTGLLTDNAQVYVAPSQAAIQCAGITVGLPSDPLNYLCGQFYNGNTYTSDPASIAVTPDSSTAYAVLNQNNTIQAIDLTQTPPVVKGNPIAVGLVPNSIVLNNGLAYVSNEGGRVATPSDFTNVSSGTPIVANTNNGSATNGTVSVINLATGAVTATIPVGVHPTGMAIANGYLYVCNEASDSISVISLAKNKVVGTISVALPINGRKSIYGATPTGIAISPDGGIAYVTLYTQNAIAVVSLAEKGSVLGYIPTASTPTTITYDTIHNQLIVSNDKGAGTWGSETYEWGVYGYNTHRDTGTVNLIPIPTSDQLAAYTTQVTQNNHWDLTANINSAKGGKPHTQPVAIPARIGDPSLIKHVFLVVRENRTYDQILGDIATANGDASLAVFAPYTPNAHALVQRFPLLDNYYDPSRQSADGHNWLVQGMAPYEDDIQSPDWIRSYPSQGQDSMAYQPMGFLWDAAEQAGLKTKIYGEYDEPAGYSFLQPNGSTSEPSWSQWYADSQAFEAGQESQLYYATTPIAVSEIPSVQNYHLPHYPPFDLDIPDQWRLDYWWQDFAADLANNAVPALTVLIFSDDHTGGPPEAQAEQADNDLAVGRFVDIISHSSVWGSSAIFITEDDAQNGVDHVDGHRSPGYVVSPYVIEYQGANSTTFTQVNFTRTIEQILGLPPMNEFDLTASPMFNLFENSPDLTPWNHVPPTIALNTGVNDGARLSPIAKAWHDAKVEMFKGGKMHKADSVDPDTLNHLGWYEATGFKRPYPGEKAVRWPSEFKSAMAHPRLED
jgi:YVTN family beta-propeller protein